MSLTGLTPEYRNWLRSSYLTNAANKIACAESPYKLVPHRRHTTPTATTFTILTMAKCKRRLPERRWHRATDAASGNWELATYMREKKNAKKPSPGSKSLAGQEDRPSWSTRAGNRQTVLSVLNGGIEAVLDCQ